MERSRNPLALASAALIVDLRFHPAAVEEMEAAIDWYRERSHQASERFALELIRAFETIRKNPRLFSISNAGTRKVAVRHFPFAVIYLVEQDELLVVAVAHLRRRPAYWRKRLG